MGKLSPQLFAILSGLVEERIGLHYDPDDADLFADKVATRMAEAGFENAIDYYYLLRYDDPSGTEMAALTDTLVVGETYLFRELDAVRVAIDVAIRPAIERRGRARIWSAGCATGEEAVTLAMLLATAGLLERTRIVATDVSSRALERARSATYGARSLRAVDDVRAEPLIRELAGRWIKRDVETGASRASRTLVDAIDFRRVNLLDPDSVKSLGAFDLVLCRNVLIYFRDEVVHRVASLLAGSLEPGGRLLVGASESLLRFGTMLTCEERAGVFFYT